MSTALKRVKDVPTAEESAMAENSSKLFAHFVEKDQVPKLQILERGKTKPVEIPFSAMLLFVDILEQMAQGNSVGLVSIENELTTQEAANLLNVSRPFLVQLLEDGKMPFRKVGTKRRVLAKHVLDFKKKTEKQRLRVLAKLSDQAQKLGMGY
jgi:excisionase family DNA binding protein